ncbi:hypothetical protein DGMP_12570 [Desulfomarina profundi]|uniref:O-GlcNAc transferase C-terminal domain-containing protein n=1 Tax=Desulfomarina profundi TaxID=2772557 RepID=A0A8D5FRT9_9BACT|nr:tetratricopeptide repeat protein [Desulfomarina profundi]BCL60564.1 hypothetical protein DGMP_12570 [Desulfomarina profundi]
MNSSQKNEEQLQLISEALEKGQSLLHNGAADEAEQYFRAVLDLMPDHPEANYLIGSLCRQKNLLSLALSHFETALDQNPEHGPYWISYIDALAETGQTEEAGKILDLAQKAGLAGDEVDALSHRLYPEKSTSELNDPDPELQAELIALYERKQFTECEALARQILTTFPENGNTLKILGAVLKQQNRVGEAIDTMLKAAQYLPEDALLFNNLGIIFENEGLLSESEEMLQRAISLDPGFAEAYNNLGVTFRSFGRLKDAEQAFNEAIRLQPDYTEAHSNLGITLKDLGRLTEAEKSLRTALELNPRYGDGYNNLGNVLHSAGRLGEAEQNFLKALELNEHSAIAHNNLGNTLHCMGELDKAEECYRAAMNLDPEYTEPFDGLLFISNYHPDLTSNELFSRYKKYDTTFGLPQKTSWKPHQNSPSTDRRLRVGYVSPAFSRHPVFNFLEPLLANHDSSSFELFAYSETIRDDEITDRYKHFFHHWIPTTAYSDDQLAERIREDRIDILVDLAGHTGRNRLGVFARKPAPVSLHWLDFGYTTGLTAIDYYLSDPFCAPFGSEKYFSEKIWRLTVPSFVYRPSRNMGPVGELPACTNNYITFGTLTRAIRINHRTIRLWSQLLKRVENSRLIIDSGNFKDTHSQQKLLDKFIAHGIEKERIQVGFHSPPWDILRQIDITLDCFPHNSGTTLFESLYMGIPYITLADRPGVGRIGSSILQGIGHPEWIAANEQEYLDKAVQLASGIEQLSHLRKSLRNEMETGKLMDHQGFTGQVENAYRSMFRIWSDSQNNNSKNRIDPEAVSLFNRGIDFLQEKRYDQAKNQFINALNIQHDFADAWNNLGVVFQQLGNYREAESCLTRALQYRPEYTDAIFNLANTHKIQHNLEPAEKYYRQVISLQPDYHLALYNLGNILQEQGRHRDAENFLRKATDLKPDHINSYSTLLFTLNYDPDISAKDLFLEYKKFDDRFCLPLKKHWQPHTNTSRKNRRLKIGYCAADYRKHPARYFIIPLLANHDRDLFQIYSFVAVPEHEAESDIFHGHVDNWLSTTQLSDQQLVETIRAAGIDILVDLAGHTAGSRLLVFARKPAPVSLHWLDYGYTTGLSAIDYYLTDHITVPQGSEHLFSETPWYIDTPAQAYRPPEDTGPVNDLPAATNNYITFGTLTRAARINYKTIRTWAEILHAVPDSKLVINSGSFKESSMQHQMEQQFLSHGIEKNRLKIGCNSPPWDVFRQIDISLDCFPHNSGTTLVESLYMGVPYITLAARPGMGRIGSSILYGVDHPDWIADTENEYIQLAIQLASDIKKLSEIRKNLRRTLELGPMMDEKAFTLRVEQAYREMFDRWYQGKNKPRKKQRSKKQKKQRTNPTQKEQARLVRLFNSGKQQEALSLAQSLVKKHPDSGFTWKILGPLLFQQGATEKAIQAMKQAAALLPDDPEAHFNLAIGLEQSGNLRESIEFYRSTLRLKSDNSQAYYNLGNVLFELGELDEAITAFLAAIKNHHEFYEAYCNLGNLFRHQEKYHQALEFYEKALTINPKSSQIYSNLGLTLKELNKLDDAEKACKKAIELQPDSCEAFNNLGLVYQEKNAFKDSRNCYLKALDFNQSFVPALNNLALLFLEKGQLEKANHYCDQALSISPVFFEAHRCKGMILHKAGKLEESEISYYKALSIHPNDIKTLNNLAITKYRRGFSAEAESICRKIIKRKPDYIKAYNNLSNILIRKGELLESELLLQKSLELDPDNILTISNLLFQLNYHPDKCSKSIFQEYLKFNALFEKPRKNQWTDHENSPSAGRRLKIGYVGSSQFLRHSARYCLEPLLEHHNREKFELFTYAELYGEDEQTRRYKTFMEHWFVTTGLSDQSVAEQIRRDGIDILVDLAGHTEGNRLGVFALKPSPVSLHWLDYGYTTGLTAIDYYLTDKYIVPEKSEEFFSEKVWRLENPSLAYRPAPGMGEVSPLPARTNGYITFGTLTRAIRLNDRTLRTWAAILKKVRGSRLVIDSGDYQDPDSRKKLEEKFGALGIEKNRLKIGFHTPHGIYCETWTLVLTVFPIIQVLLFLSTFTWVFPISP